MKKYKALKDFGNMSYSLFLNKALAVQTGFTGNPGFPNPAPTMEELDAAIRLFSQAMAQAESRDKVKVEHKKVMRNSLHEVLSQMVDYANYIANGDRALLLSTGLTVTAETDTPGVLGSVGNCKVVQGKNSGEVIISIAKADNAKSYAFCYGDLPVVDDNWKIQYGTITKMKISGLVRGKEYAFRVGAIARGQTVYSPITNFLVS